MDARSVRFICTGQGRGGHPRWTYPAVRLVGEYEVQFVVPSRPSSAQRRGILDRPGAASFDIRCTHARCGRNPRLKMETMRRVIEAILAAIPDTPSVEFDIGGPGSAILYKPD